jgi:hypothetical protein
MKEFKEIASTDTQRLQFAKSLDGAVYTLELRMPNPPGSAYVTATLSARPFQVIADGAKVGDSMAIRVGINGFGSMGRLALRAAWGRPGVEFVHINEVAGGPETAAHLLTFDSVHGRCAVANSEPRKH